MSSLADQGIPTSWFFMLLVTHFSIVVVSQYKQLLLSENVEIFTCDYGEIHREKSKPYTQKRGIRHTSAIRHICCVEWMLLAGAVAALETQIEIALPKEKVSKVAVSSLLQIGLATMAMHHVWCRPHAESLANTDLVAVRNRTP